MTTEVIEVDRFGNIGLALSYDKVGMSSPRMDVEVVGECVPQWSARRVYTYGDLAPGELGLYRDSWGQVALALNGASAAEVLGVQRGMLLRISPLAEARSSESSGLPGVTATDVTTDHDQVGGVRMPPLPTTSPLDL